MCVCVCVLFSFIFNLGTLNDVDSIDRGSTSNLSDGDEWEDVITGNEVHQIRQQMEGLEMMYTEILKMLGLDKEYIPGSRRSISSLSSISRSGTRRTRSNAFSHRTSREMRSLRVLKYNKHKVQYKLKRITIPYLVLV